MEKKIKGISRIDQESKMTHGWYARVSFQGKIHSKFFSDKKNGGRIAAKLAAISWRDNTEKSLGKDRTNKRMVTATSSSTGMVGVRFNENLNRYEVSWVSGNGKQGKTSVSVVKHGKRNAFTKACRIRQMKEAERLAA